ncbi:MAG TPA: energy transducer TonB [Bryobacteraceae bacterium]|jgi:protein TonB
MFSQTFVDVPAKSGKPRTMVLSMLLEACALAVLLLIPLVYTQVLPNAQLRSVLAAPAAPLASLPKPVTATNEPRRAAARIFNPTVLPAVPAVTKQINPSSESAVPPDVGTPAASAAVGTGDLIGTGPGIAVPPLPPPARQVQHGPIRVGSISEANLIHKVQPIYPALAKSTRVQGIVEFTATISKQGTIENLRLVRGHPLLVNAARDAILQWKYRPTVLNGEPVEVITDILVDFTLNQ